MLISTEMACYLLTVARWCYDRYIVVMWDVCSTEQTEFLGKRRISVLTSVMIIPVKMTIVV